MNTLRTRKPPDQFQAITNCQLDSLLNLGRTLPSVILTRRIQGLAGVEIIASNLRDGLTLFQKVHELCADLVVLAQLAIVMLLFIASSQ